MPVLFLLAFFMALAACGDSGASESRGEIAIPPAPFRLPEAPTYIPPPPAPRAASTPAPAQTAEPEATPEPAPEPAPLVFTIPHFPMTAGQVTADFNEMTATEWTAAIRMGWNLGNTLDAHGGPGGWSWLGGGRYENTSVLEMERAWVGRLTTRSNIEALADAGFNALRVTVTWFKAMDSDYNIREDWMARVKEIVDWGLDAGMFVILNTHHDEYIFHFTDDLMYESQYAFARAWQQIAYTFRDYNERLLFEGLNEPRTPGSPAEWSGGTAEEWHNLNILNQLFVDVVRASGGNNAYRVLMVPTYAASSTASAQQALVVPTDTVPDRIIVSLHIYAPWEFALRTGASGVRVTWSANNVSDTRPITDPLDLAYELFVSQGIPVIIGEMGALNRGNEEARAEWAYFFISNARQRGMPTVWWDNGMTGITSPNEWGGWDETFGLLDRAENRFEHLLLMDAIMRAAANY